MQYHTTLLTLMSSGIFVWIPEFKYTGDQPCHQSTMGDIDIFFWVSIRCPATSINYYRYWLSVDQSLYTLTIFTSSLPITRKQNYLYGIFWLRDINEVFLSRFILGWIWQFKRRALWYLETTILFEFLSLPFFDQTTLTFPSVRHRRPYLHFFKATNIIFPARAILLISPVNSPDN